MKPPVEHVRVSAKGKETLIKIKRRTGIEHWNEICRIALCRSLASNTLPPRLEKYGESSIEMDWKVFAGPIHDELNSILAIKMSNDGIDQTKRENVSNYFRYHLERGIQTLHNVNSLSDLLR